MEPTAWKLEDRWARLRLGRIAATLDLLEPQRGLHELWIDEIPWHGARMLAVDMGSIAPSKDAHSFDAYVRGSDLVVTYEQTEARPLRAQVYWRATGGRTPAAPTTLELVVSVQTSLWQSDADLTVGSIVPGAEPLRLLDPTQDRFEPVSRCRQKQIDEPGFSWGVAKQIECDPSTGAGCFLFRPPQTEISYAEMVHPVDFSRSVVSIPAKLDTHREVRHRLFVQRLEKGVILRARVRGTLLARQDDAAAAATVFREFAAAEPPLTT